MRLIALFLAVIVMIAPFTAAQAAPAECSTRIDGEPVTIFFNTDDPTFSSFRERFLRRNRAACPGAVVITYLTPDLSAEEREVFCANYDEKLKSYSQPALGKRDNFGRCAEPSRTCQLVNTTKQEAMILAGLGQQTGRASGENPLRRTLTTLTHSSGAMILSGNGAALVNMISQTGAVVGSALATPAVLAGAAASVVVIGGAVYLCADDA